MPDDIIQNKIRAVARKFLSDEEFNSALKHHVEALIKGFDEEKKDGLVPQLFVEGFRQGKPTGVMIMLAVGGDDFDNKKQELFVGIGHKMATEMPDFTPKMIFMESEAWLKTMSDEQEKERQKLKKAVRDYDDKQEVIIISGMTVDKRCNMATLSISRAKDNTVIIKGKPRYDYYKDEKKAPENYLLERFFFGYSVGIKQKNNSNVIEKGGDTHESKTN